MSTQKPEYFPSLEGIRGYAFLAVFFVHYTAGSNNPHHLRSYLVYVASRMSWFLVPIFFALSGFLITRILIATREREGYLRVFYLRRAVRILPLYYSVVAIAVVVAVAAHWTPLFQPHHLLYLFYLQNFTLKSLSPHINTSHLWSLAIEEQFYLFWPFAVLLLRDDRSLLRFSYMLIAACTLFRLAWPLWGMSNEYAYFITPTRVDGIILGAVLAIHYKRKADWARLVVAAKVAVPLLFCALVVFTIFGPANQAAITDSYARIAFGLPAMNLIGTGLVILALTPDNIVAKICSGQSICKFGQLTYGLYLLHDLVSPFVVSTVWPWLGHHMSLGLVQIVAAMGVLLLTTVAAALGYKFIEEPCMKLKSKLKYGPVRETRAPVPWFATVGLTSEAVE
jgi:peptidoglycan/LPS O-acetylase OafA/YrhL